MLDKDIGEVLFSSATLQKRVRELGERITRDYAGRPLHLVIILKGAFVFCADLLRHIDLDLSLDFIVVSSYGSSTETSGTVRIVKDLQRNIEGLDVLFIEDIVDTGLTMSYLRSLLLSRKPRSLKTCSLLSKSECRRVEVPVEYVGFEIPNKFVVGYGLDYDQRYRQLPYIGVISESAIKAGAKGDADD